MEKAKEEIPVSQENLEMTNDEFKFIRKKLKISQKDIVFLSKSLSAESISSLEREKFVNPAMVYPLLSGAYAPRVVVDKLRSEWRESKGTKND